MIRVEGLHKYFFRHKKNEIHVLNDMTIDFPDTGLVVLLGPSGSGKTTLLNVIGGLDNIQQGTIEFDNQVIHGYNTGTWDKLRNESIGYVFQNYNLLPHLSVFDNIALVLKMMGISDPEIVENRVNYILNAVNMYPYRKKKSTQLSGGQQQRVAIARALVKNPRVIIADEPTGNLDSKNTLDIMNIIKEISKQKLVVLVTHEKDIAKIYGDRILEIKDGVVIDDYVNEALHDHEVSDDNVIYLKDLDQLSEMKDTHVSIDLFNDSKQVVEPVQIRLIVKNKTLYIDVDSQFNKVKLVDSSSNLVIKNENYVKKNREEMFETSFKLEALDNKDVHRNFKTIVSLKQIFMLALQKIIYSSRRGKIMLFSFIMAGAVIAVALSLAAATIIPDLSSRRFEDNYVIVSERLTDKITYQQLEDYSGDNADLYVNTLNQLNIEVIDPAHEEDSLFTFAENIDILEHAKGKILEGRNPIADDEIIISSVLADRMISTTGSEFGIWSYKHLLVERYRTSGQEIKIVGVIESDISIIYVSRNFSNLISPITVEITPLISPIYYGTMAIEQVSLTYGMMPTGDQVLISRTLFDALSSDPIDNSWPKTFDELDQVVSGVYDQIGYSVIASNETIEKYRFDMNTSYYVYTSNPNLLVLNMSADEISAKDEINQIIDNFNNTMLELRITVSIVAAVVVSFVMLGFYFVMHSSMISRIYEISVYRALGMKKSELFISFLVEILIISTITSLIGFAIASYGISLASDTLLGQFRIFLVTPLTVLIGIIVVYGINILGGMIPIMLLLRKTPAQILSQYDI
ncbi:MAG: ABC transporter ATP-binding protein/permease [Firmicutes bacterium]|nr:ABC transporter ATP-binding protein/permease [Bacillota bacterium]